jgi:rhodanese-related sulfurtransferase
MENFFLFVGQQWMLVGALMMLVFLFIRHETMRGGEMLSVHQLSNKVNREGAVVLDVRDAAEYRQGHITDSINIPFAKVAERISELEPYREKPVILVDKMGQHSGSVGRQLAEAGFSVARLEGGIMEWKNGNLPLVSE